MRIANREPFEARFATSLSLANMAEAAAAGLVNRLDMPGETGFCGAELATNKTRDSVRYVVFRNVV